MKKALIAIISVIYVVAIVIVSFLGIRAEVHNETIYVQEIVLENRDTYKPYVPEIEANRISRVLKRPSDDMIDADGVGIEDRVNWDYNGRKRDYAIYIDNYTYLFDKLGGKYTIYASVRPVEASFPELSYHLSATQAVKDGVTLTNTGDLTFTLQHEGWVSFDVDISSTDQSGVEIDVLFKISGYN